MQTASGSGGPMAIDERATTENEQATATMENEQATATTERERAAAENDQAMASHSGGEEVAGRATAENDQVTASLSGGEEVAGRATAENDQATASLSGGEEVAGQMENIDYEQFLKVKRNKWNEESLINVGCRLKNIATIEKIIRKEGKHKEFMSSCFKQFTNFPQKSLFSATVVHGVLLREIRIEGATENELFISFGGKKARFGRREFCLVTGLRFGELSEIINTPYVANANGIHKRYWPGQEGEDLKLSTVYQRFLKRKFKDPDDSLKICCLPHSATKLEDERSQHLPQSFRSRHRLSFSNEETSKRKFQRNKVFKDVEKALHVPIQYRNLNCKIPTLKVVMIIILLGSLLTLFRYPAVNIADHPSSSSSRSSFVDRWVRQSANMDPISINFRYAEHVALHMDYVSSNITWELLYPEWIDEEEEFEVPTCPSLPKLLVPGKPRIDLIAVKLPCNKLGRWSRDVARLHLQLEAARLAASSKGLHSVHVLLLTDCFPIPNLFTCKDIVLREGNAWLYKPNLNKLREKLQLPVDHANLQFLSRLKRISTQKGHTEIRYNPSFCKFICLWGHCCSSEHSHGRFKKGSCDTS
ncbi:hypothetical protein LWI29_029525 [Acer saccharum]|uniref:DUF1985 domain-containing protein n=1 Tax=Acer saccharum TaxID=4024 RepID=A0AA39RMI9_ACESA|nr:hypothetical protein LWI29_029525 [Acer saccharum]